MVESFFDGRPSAELLLSPHVTISDSIWTFLGILVNISLRIHLFAQLYNIKLGGGGAKSDEIYWTICTLLVRLIAADVIQHTLHHTTDI